MSRFLFSIVCISCMGLSQLSYAQSSPVCRSQAADPDGDGFGFENGVSCIITNESEGPPTFTNRVTGEPVNLVRAYWDGLVDFNNPVSCTRWQYSNGSADYLSTRQLTISWGPLTTAAPYVGVASNGLPWSMDNGIYTGPTNLGKSPWFEIVNVGSQKAVRTWFSSNLYNECAAVDPNVSFAPTGRPYVPPAPQGCVDTAPIGDGWGWDGSTSCRVDGGREPESGSCIDTAPVGDGWGWDGSSSCRVGEREPDSGSCVDTPPAGDGWGWNGSTSCRVSGDRQPDNTTCVDTAPVGDGWGWDGSSSCRVSGDRQPDGNACVDTAPVGDGWGWDGSTSCRVSGDRQPEGGKCIDSPPVGDGWGWDGQTSCRI